MTKKTVSALRRFSYQETHPLCDPQQGSYRIADTQDPPLVVTLTALTGHDFHKNSNTNGTRYQIIRFRSAKGIDVFHCEP